ncbi:hypothetical protein JCM5353_000798 [Sporobolomyces roseus]
MPIPSLPLEIVGEIVSHLRTSLLMNPKEPIVFGKAISLVCRAWYPIGRFLRWRSLRLVVSQVSSLSAHLLLYPHLSPLIRGLRCETLGWKDDTLTDHVIDLGFHNLTNLLPTTIKIRKLVISGVSERTIKHVLQAASNVPALQFFRLHVKGHVMWTSELTSILSNGFPSLTSLELGVSRISTPPPNRNPIVSTQVSFQLKKLYLGWKSSHVDTPSLLQSFFPLFDAATLRNCTLSVSTVNITAFSWLADCPNLQILTTFMEERHFASTLTALINLLPRLVSLEMLHLMLQDEIDAMYFSVKLDVLLGALPVNLKTVEARQLLFSDYTSVPRRSKPTALTTCRRIEGLQSNAEDEEEDEDEEERDLQKFALLLWTEEQNSSVWYRDMMGFTTWEKVDEVYLALQSLLQAFLVD